MRAFFSILLLAIAVPVAVVAQTAAAWPEADKLFRSDPRWLGADVASSVDLGNRRVLWMFGDTFVSRRPGETRKNPSFVRNTVAIQTGYDPARASIKFYWRTTKGKPTEIFPSEGETWMWPSHGIRLASRLLLFCSRVAPDRKKNSLGFQLVGWVVYIVANPDEEPSAWKLQKIAEDHDKIILASTVLREGEFVFLAGVSEPEHDLYLARLTVDAAAQGRFDALEWWSGKGWESHESSAQLVIRAAGTEASVQRDPRGGGFLEVNSQGFGASDIVMRYAPQLEGDWSPPQKIYRPPESNAPDAFVYAGKSHPELRGADLVITYVANGNDTRLAQDMSIYFPRFVKVQLSAHASTPGMK
jgi:hypothetical protein